jgi:hypothetical protein
LPFDAPFAARVVVEVEAVDVERADVRIIRLRGIPLPGPFMDLDVAVVSVFVRHGNCSTRVEQQHDDREHAQEFLDPAHSFDRPFQRPDPWVCTAVDAGAAPLLRARVTALLRPHPRTRNDLRTNLKTNRRGNARNPTP